MKTSFQFAAGVALVLASVRAFADAGDTAIRSTAWNWSAYITVPLFAMAVMYLAGLFRMRARGARLRALPIFCLCSGWLCLFLALDSPIHEISEQLFWVHMTQHEILMLISAPLVVLSQPAAPLLLALPESWRPRIVRFGKANLLVRTWLLISAPLSAWLLHAAALWVWHAPKLFDATLHSEPVHAAQHISFFGTALLFWWTLFHKHAGSLGYGGAILYVFTTAIHTSLLGALLTFAPRVWYASYARSALLWGFTGLQDQQLGGLIMWIPAGTLLTVVALALLGRWMSHSDTRWEYTRAAALVRASHGANGMTRAAILPLALLTGMLSSCDQLTESRVRAAYVTTGGGNARTGRETIRKYACYACHTIDGVPGAHGLVGPPLDGVGNREFIAGELPNTPDNLVRWIQHPRQVEPHTVMPEMGVTEQDSRDIAAYLYTLRKTP